jgi:hypothetical protein
MSQSRERTRRLSLGTAVTFVVAAIAGVVGGKVTGDLTPALVIFAVLVVGGAAISYWVDRRSRASSSDDDATAGLIDARGARTVQNNIAMAPGSVALGTLGDGRVIPHDDVMESDAPAVPGQPVQGNASGPEKDHQA